MTTSPWRAVLDDGSSLDLEARDRAHAISSAQELAPRGRRVVRVVRQGDF